jgi:hypothetical protein
LWSTVTFLTANKGIKAKCSGQANIAVLSSDTRRANTLARYRITQPTRTVARSAVGESIESSPALGTCSTNYISLARTLATKCSTVEGRGSVNVTSTIQGSGIEFSGEGEDRITTKSFCFRCHVEVVLSTKLNEFPCAVYRHHIQNSFIILDRRNHHDVVKPDRTSGWVVEGYKDIQIGEVKNIFFYSVLEMHSAPTTRDSRAIIHMQ